MTGDVLAYKVLLMAGKMKLSSPTKGAVLGMVQSKAHEYGVKNKKVIQKAERMVLERLQVVR